MPVIPLADPSDPRLDDYRNVPDPELLRRRGLFVAEGRLVVRVLLGGSMAATRSLLVTETALHALIDVIEPRLDGLPVYVVPQSVVQDLTGFDIHRGCLAIGERPDRLSIGDLLARHPAPRALVVLEQVANADNIGGVFRNAAAFGVGGVVLGPGCCDPLYRKAIRVSMGATLRVPWARAAEWPGELEELKRSGFTVAALTPRPPAVPIGAFARGGGQGRRLALLAGSEGAGLSEGALAAADVALRIPMVPGADSLNVATATGIALQRLVLVTGGED